MNNQQQNHTTKSKLTLDNRIIATSKPGRRGEAKYQAVCIACNTTKTKRLITFKRADGRDLSLCRKHARAYLGEI